jgi:hypothetical protein
MSLDPKVPSLVIFWTDTRLVLSYREKKDIEFYGNVVSVTPFEVLIENPMTGRTASIRGVGDPHAPEPPSPHGEEV